LWAADRRDFDLRDLKGLLEGLLEGLDAVHEATDDPLLRPGQSIRMTRSGGEGAPDVSPAPGPDARDGAGRAGEAALVLTLSGNFRRI